MRAQLDEHFYDGFNINNMHSIHGVYLHWNHTDLDASIPNPLSFNHKGYDVCDTKTSAISRSTIDFPVDISLLISIAYDNVRRIDEERK